MKNKVTYAFKNKMWQDSASGGWYFVAIPKNLSKEIRTNFKNQEEGWGRMKIIAIVEKIEWKTSIWFDTKSDHYLLPIKAEIRKKGRLRIDHPLEVTLLI